MALLDPREYVRKVVDQVPFLVVSSKDQGHFLFEVVNNVDMGLHTFKHKMGHTKKIRKLFIDL